MRLHLLRNTFLLIALATAPACDNARGDARQGGGPGGPGGGPGGPGGGPGGRGNNNNRPTPVEVVTVSRGSIARTTTVAGQLEPLRTVGVNAQLSGPLLSVRVEEGNRVRAGQLLAQIDAAELDAQVKSAVAALEFAESTAKRSDELWREKIITAAEYERDRAALAAARATLEQLRTRLGYATIQAPMSGVITEKYVETGDIVSPQTRLFSIADVSTLVARVMVSELEAPALRPGAPVDVTVDALGGIHTAARIRRVFPAADSATRLVPVEVGLTGSILEQLRPGYTIRATFRLGERANVLMVPTRALLGPVGARVVFVARDGRAERRAVRAGSDVEGNTEVFEGLQFGDSVVVAGNALLRDGGLIRVVPPLSPLESPATLRSGDSGGVRPGAAAPGRRPDSVSLRAAARRSE